MGNILRATLAFVGLALLGACGGGGSSYSDVNAVTSARVAPAMSFAQGPIARACLETGRQGADRTRCGCVQAVADLSLSGSDQRRGAEFFKDPHMAQVMRQSDNPSHEAFWQRWKAYGAKAEQLCRT